MNVLFITGLLPFPLDNGRKIRTYNLIKKLSENNNVTLIISEEKNVHSNNITEMKKFCKDIRIVPYKPLSAMQLFFRLILSLFRKEPFALIKRFSKKIQQEVDRLLKNRQLDVVICDRLTETLYILDKCEKVIKVYSTHNIEHLLVRRFFESTTNIFKKIASYMEWKKMADYERKVWKNFNFSIAVSEHDKKIMSEFVSADRVFVVANGIDTESFQYKDSIRVPQSVIYTGQMGWYPNKDAVLYFVDEIYPLIKKEIPNLKFFIVGNNTSQKIQKLGQGNNGIEVIGHVDDIKPYINKSTIVIVPLRIGSGTRIKILEALAMEKPVISTSVGCEGLDVTDGENIVIADEPAEFAHKTVSLLKDGVACEKLGKAGRKLVKERYDWGVVGNQLVKFQNSLENAARKIW